MPPRPDERAYELARLMLPPARTRVVAQTLDCEPCKKTGGVGCSKLCIRPCWCRHGIAK